MTVGSESGVSSQDEPNPDAMPIFAPDSLTVSESGNQNHKGSILLDPACFSAFAIITCCGIEDGAA